MHVKDTELTLLGKNDLVSNYSDEMGHLLILRNNKNQVTGFDVNIERVMHLRFNKIE